MAAAAARAAGVRPSPAGSVPGTPASVGGASAAGGGAGRGGDEFSALDAHAIPFITVDDDDRFVINEDAVAYLRSLTGKIAVVSIAGA